MKRTRARDLVGVKEGVDGVIGEVDDDLLQLREQGLVILSALWFYALPHDSQTRNTNDFEEKRERKGKDVERGKTEERRRYRTELKPHL